MIVETSALIAIVREEPEENAFIHALEAADVRRMSAANYLEAAIVIDGTRSPIATRGFDDFITRANITIEPVTAEQAVIARAAYRDFGKGSGNPAKLNFGDCFAYALAKASDEPLLFKGDEFSYTDVKPALGR